MNAVMKPLSPCARGIDESRTAAIEHCNELLAARTAQERIAWALDHLPGRHVLSSSFGAQSAVSLHMMSRIRPDVAVIFIDTGYHFPETYRFVDQLTDHLQLNLHVYRSRLSAGWQEARYGERWAQGVAGLDAYNRDNKVEPMQRALRELGAGTWFAGLRREQSETRRDARILAWSEDHWKMHPIADWSDRDVSVYLREHHLPYHPLWEKGYVSIGDRHTTRALSEVEDVNEVRFFGLKRECGLHDRSL